jgi:hypothetical protein
MPVESEFAGVPAGAHVNPTLVNLVVGLARHLLAMPGGVASALSVEQLTEADKLHEKAGDRARAQAERHRSDAAGAGANAKARGDALAKAAEAEKQASARFKKAQASFTRAADLTTNDASKASLQGDADRNKEKDRRSREAAKTDHENAGESYDNANEPGLAGEQYDAAGDVAESLVP